MERIDFLATDGINLNGFIYKADTSRNSKKVILAVHGMSSNCFKKRDEIIAKKMNEKLNQENISEEQKNIIEKAVEIGLEALE